MGISDDASRVQNKTQYDETMDRVYGVKLHLPPIGSTEHTTMIYTITQLLEKSITKEGTIAELLIVSESIRTYLIDNFRI